jgi:hypothetical protein
MHPVGDGGLGKGLSRRIYALLGALAALLAIGFGPTAAGASAEETAVTFPGSPLTVSIGPLGQCQSNYPNHGNNFYPEGNPLGDCGFFLAFPTAGSGQPAPLQKTTWGFNGNAGPRLPLDGEGGMEYVPVSQSAVSGSGTTASPYTQTTVFKVSTGGKDYALITETTTYVSGEPQFISSFVVKNITEKPATKIYFRAIYAGDLFVNGNDFGSGVFLAGSPKFIGGLNTATGIIGGFVETGPLPWSSFQEGCWNDVAVEGEGGRCTGAVPSDQGVWHDVRSTVDAPRAFNETTDPAEIDNAAGVEWDQFRESGLEAGKEQTFTIINRTQVPSTLQISPVNRTLTQGQTETITVTALDITNQPYAGKSVRYTVSGANPQSGSVVLNAAGQAQISYVGHNAGIDTTQLFVDLAGNGVKTLGDPSGTATVTFVPPPPTPNSSYKVQSIHANSDGTITIVFVPTQSGAATLEVTVPTGTIARKEAIAARRHRGKKCRRGQIKIKGKCRPKTTVSGKVSATGVGGVPLTLTVKPSGKVTRALKKGRTVHLTATLTYKSALGGTPTVQTFHFTVKGKRHHRKKH